MAWFDPKAALTDHSNFNYTDRQAQIERQRAFAKQLMQTQIPTGQMVGDWYAAPSKGAQVAGVVQQLLGAYGQRKADASAKQLNADQVSATKAFAEDLSNMNRQGVQSGTTMDDEYGTQPVYSPATVTDKAGLYERGLNSGSQMAKLLIQNDLTRSTARPSYDEVDVTKDLYVTDPRTGVRTLVKQGRLKPNDLERKIETLQSANPGWTRAQAVAAATNALDIDPVSGAVVNKQDWMPGSTAPAPQAAPPQPAASGVPPRGQTFNGPTGAPAPVSNFPRATAVNPAQQARQAKVDREVANKVEERTDRNAPKVQEARDQYSSNTQGLTALRRLKELVLSGDAWTGAVLGRLPAMRAADQQAEQLAKQLVLAQAGGKLGAGVSNADVQFLQDSGAARQLDKKVLIDYLSGLEARMVTNGASLTEQLNSYGAAPTAGGATGTWGESPSNKPPLRFN